MQVIISGRHFNVSEDIKRHIENKLADSIDKQSLKITSVRVVVAMEKQSRFKAEVVINMKNHCIEADAETYEVCEAVDIAIDKAASQVRKVVEKVQSHKKVSLRDVIQDASATETEVEMELE